MSGGIATTFENISMEVDSFLAHRVRSMEDLDIPAEWQVPIVTIVSVVKHNV